MPRKRGPRVKLATNIYRDDIGIGAIARVQGTKPKELRFDPRTPLHKIRAALDAKRIEMRVARDSTQALAAPGSLGAVITSYLHTIVNPRGTRIATTLLTPWLIALGPRAIEDLTNLDFRRVVNEWIEAQRLAEAAGGSAGHAASTINHRRRELAKAWDAVLPERKNLVRQVPKAREPEPEDRAVDMRVLDALIDEIPVKSTGARQHARNQARVRLRAMLWTGMAPATLSRIKVHDVDLDRATVRVQPRRKGRGVEPVIMPLFPEGVRAMRAWLHAFAWGRYSQSSVWKTFKRAVRKYEAKMAAAGTPVSLPPDLRPYDLRHSFLSWLVDAKDADPLTVQLFAQHASLETTKRYTQRAIAKRAARLTRGETVDPTRGSSGRKE